MTRVALTTDRFFEAAASYTHVGLVPVSLPCIRFEPVTDARIAAARASAIDADLLLITSSRVVDLLWSRGGMPNVEVAAVGPSTADAVLEAGGRVGVVGDAGLGRLIDLTGDRLNRGRVMIAHAAGSDPTAMTRLRAIVAELDEHVVYRMVPVGPKILPVDAVAFASPSAVGGWGLTRTLDNVVVGAIGETTAHAVSQIREPDIVADSPSHSSLARGIASFMEVKA
jgi:uroporphyrinogen-III synthase